MDFSKLKPCLEKYAKTPGTLIAILQEAQELYGWLSPELLAYVARETGIPPAKVMGVATFYAQFRDKPVGKHLILLCQGTACHVNGSAEIERAVREYLNVEEGEITPDGLFTYNNVACLGCCSLSPVMMIDGKAYGKLTGKSAVEVLERIKGENHA
ncbi:MAG: NADH-quinone oxidoreductase subunit NuoE [Oscillospiraceae bacterium]|nr:NADH-quinone oxidoreductase subunit NuoE [Oscillospiraceae bacterium]